MTAENKSQEKIRIFHTDNGSVAGALWSIGWLFTIAFARLIWWKALLAIIIWPYYLGLAVQ